MTNELDEQKKVSPLQENDSFTVHEEGLFHCSTEHKKKFLDCLVSSVTTHDESPPTFPPGNYAICIQDHSKGTLYLANDWLGARPLYYTQVDGNWHWSFNLSDLVKLQPNRIIDLRALDEFFTYRWLNEDTTLVKGIKRVLPGRIVYLAKNEAPIQKLHTRKSYTLKNNKSNFNEVVEKTDAALNSYFQNIRKTQKNVAIFLSGGVDSSLLAAYAKRNSCNAVAVTAELVGYPNPELTRAREVAARLGIEHLIVKIEPNYLPKKIVQLTKVLEMPVTYMNNFVRLALFEALQGQVSIALTGEGADGMFGSEVGRPNEIARMRERRIIFDKLPHPARAALHFFYTKLRDRSSFYEPELRLAVRRIGEFFPHPEKYVKVLRRPRHLRDSYFYGYLEDDQQDLNILRRDRGLFTQNRHQMHCYTSIGKSTGIEVDSPFLGEGISTIGLDLPLIHREDEKGSKPILRQLLLRDLPEDIVYAPKMGFETPYEGWLEGPLSEIWKLVSDEITRNRNIYDLKEISSLQDVQMRWSLLACEIFLREFGLEDHRS